MARELKYYSRSYGGLRDPSFDGSDGSLEGRKLEETGRPPKIPPDFLAKKGFEQWNLEVETFDNLSSFGD